MFQTTVIILSIERTNIGRTFCQAQYLKDVIICCPTHINGKPVGKVLGCVIAAIRDNFRSIIPSF